MRSAIQVEEVTANRTLPYAFYDQALASIPVLYPEAEIVGGARFRRSGSIIYAYIAYRPAKDAATLLLEMSATDDLRAWHLTTEALPSQLDARRQALLKEVRQRRDENPSACPEVPLPAEPSEVEPGKAAGI
jgi:hypothetical protein